MLSALFRSQRDTGEIRQDRIDIYDDVVICLALCDVGALARAGRTAHHNQRYLGWLQAQGLNDTGLDPVTLDQPAAVCPPCPLTTLDLAIMATLAHRGVVFRINELLPVTTVRLAVMDNLCSDNPVISKAPLTQGLSL